jgi:hypothetical protein
MDKRIWIHHTLPDLSRRNKCGYRHHTTTESLTEGHDIRRYIPVIDAKYLPCTTKPCLYFISDEKRSMFASELSDSWPVVIGRDNCPRLSLDRLDDDSGDTYPELFTGFELLLHSESISILDEVDRTPIHLSYRFTVESLSHHRE